MYRAEKTTQLTFEGFNQSCGMKLKGDDEWVRLAGAIPWDAVEEAYGRRFKSGRGRPAVPARIALGALVIQRRMNLSDRNLVKEVARNPYLQYFLGLGEFQPGCPFGHGVLPELRKRIGADFVNAVNELVLEGAGPTPEHAGEAAPEPSAGGCLGTMILDATCSPSNIRYPQDSSLLNEARGKLDAMIDALHAMAGESDGRRPRTYRRVLRKAHLAFAKSRRRTAEDARAAVRLMLGAVRRNLAFVDGYIARGFAPDAKGMALLGTIRALYAQQLGMHRGGTHRVPGRIVSVSQPFVRPVVRGKDRAPVEFGAKFDVSVDERGHARLERASFEPYNECTVLADALERYRARTGRYPARVLADRAYRTEVNRRYCEERGVRLSGRRRGRPPADPAKRRELRADDVDRIEVERFFSRGKRCCGAGLVVAKLPETALGSIALSVLVANLFGAVLPSFFVFYVADSRDGAAGFHLLEFSDDAG